MPERHYNGRLLLISEKKERVIMEEELAIAVAIVSVMLSLLLLLA
jgi:hypothetical protein